MNLDDIVYTKEFSYFLGYLWSDGFIERKRTILEIVEDDASNIVEDIKKIDFLKICTMKRQRKNRKPQMSIYFCNSSFYDIFQNKYFINKSESAPLDILKIIPVDLKRYFYLGLIDGDGCFYFKNKTRQFYITSSFNQDWQHIINLFEEIKIKQYEIRKIENKNGNKSSYIRVKKHQEISNLFNYLYQDGYELGLRRKYLKSKEIIDNPPKNSSNKSKIDKDDLLKKIDIGMSIYEIAKILDCSWRKIHNFCKNNNIEKPEKFYRR
jgi:hypothetical protein